MIEVTTPTDHLRLRVVKDLLDAKGRGERDCAHPGHWHGRGATRMIRPVENAASSMWSEVRLQISDLPKGLIDRRATVAPLSVKAEQEHPEISRWRVAVWIIVESVSQLILPRAHASDFRAPGHSRSEFVLRAYPLSRDQAGQVRLEGSPVFCRVAPERLSLG